MNTELIAEQSVTIEATPSALWDALVNPEKIKAYLFGTETISDWKKGSDIIFRGEFQGKPYRDRGVIREITPGRILQYTYWTGFSGLDDRPENYSLVTFTLKPAGDKTLLTVSQKGFVTEQGRGHAETAWANIIQQIKQIAEKA